MNDYTFEKLSVGMSETLDVIITEEMMEKFCDITGDLNPLHNSVNYAKENGYKDRVVYGFLTASFLSTLAGVYLPGRRCLIQSVEIKFTNPVFVGDILKVWGGGKRGT